jgi:hypothetical protein
MLLANDMWGALSNLKHLTFSSSSASSSHWASSDVSQVKDKPFRVFKEEKFHGAFFSPLLSSLKTSYLSRL